MAETPPHITAAELRILKVLWKEGPQTVRQVMNALSAEDAEPLAYTTVMTMMKQLAEKGALAVNRESLTFVYAPLVRRDQVLRQRLLQLLHTVFDGRAEDVVMQLVEDADLSAEDLRRIEAKITNREREEDAHKPHSSKRKGTKR